MKLTQPQIFVMIQQRWKAAAARAGRGDTAALRTATAFGSGAGISGYSDSTNVNFSHLLPRAGSNT